MREANILKKLLNIELESNAKKLGFIDNYNLTISNELLQESISLLNVLSANPNEESNKYLIAISALLWTYRRKDWDGLKDYLILFLSRAGFGPSSIMVDDKFNLQEKTFTESSSVINMFSITLAHLRYEIKIEEKIFLISSFQKSIWDGIDNSKVIGISAPTSAGKSYLILLKAIELLLRKAGSIIYVVPTLSLVSQVQADFREKLDEFNLDDYTIETSFNHQQVNNENSIYILTQEKAISAFSQTKNPFPSLRLLVIDEIQNVERVTSSDDTRAKVLYDLMTELKSTSIIDHIIISGPRIEHIDKLGISIFKEKAIKRETKSSPVLNITYSISKEKKSSYLNLHFDLFNTPLRLKIINTDGIVYKGSLYNNNFLNFLNQFLNTFNEHESNIIFSPTSANCTKIANSISTNFSEKNSKYLNGLSEFIASTIHPHYPLVESVKKSIVYHHGKMPYHIRSVVEHAVRKKQIRTIVCTTTLLQGVNLPVQNIIIRNPNLYLRKKIDSTQLTNYELANLRGRAGRLLKDFIGRTYILDENDFNKSESNQFEIFEKSHKELKVGYGEKFLQNQDNITEDIIEGIGNSESNKEYSYLNTYIRQTILSKGDNSLSYLKGVGIELNSKLFKEYKIALQSLEVSKEICSKNRYWDPVDLNTLYLNSKLLYLPKNSTENNLSYMLKSIILYFREHFPFYYDRYFPVKVVPQYDLVLNKCILINHWIQEKSLFDIFKRKYYDGLPPQKRTGS